MREFVSPSRYIQGENVLFTSAKTILSLGNRPVLLCDEEVDPVVGKRWRDYLQRYGLLVTVGQFYGEAAWKEIDCIAALAEASDVVIGIGGEKVIDTAKSIADLFNLPVVVAPTIASATTVTTTASIFCFNEGNYDQTSCFSKVPEIVLVDTKVICRAPKQSFVSGIVGALANSLGGQVPNQLGGTEVDKSFRILLSSCLAQACSETIFNEGVQALVDCERQVRTPALENIIEASILSGLVSEQTRIIPAYSIQRIIRKQTQPLCQLDSVASLAFATVVQLLLEHKPREVVETYLALYQQMGVFDGWESLPINAIPYEEWIQDGDVGDQLMAAVSPKEFVNTLQEVDALVKQYSF